MYSKSRSCSKRLVASTPAEERREPGPVPQGPLQEHAGRPEAEDQGRARPPGAHEALLTKILLTSAFYCVFFASVPRFTTGAAMPSAGNNDVSAVDRYNSFLDRFCGVCQALVIHKCNLVGDYKADSFGTSARRKRRRHSKIREQMSEGEGISSTRRGRNLFQATTD